MDLKIFSFFSSSSLVLLTDAKSRFSDTAYQQISSAFASKISNIDGDFLLSAGEDGAVILWNRSDGSEHDRWEENSPVLDCHISDDGTMLAWMIEGSLHVRNYDEYISYYAQIDIDFNARQFAFMNNDSDIALLIPEFGADFTRRIQFMNIKVDGFPITNTLSIGHIASDFSIHPEINRIAISTDSRLISIYSDTKYSTTPSNGLDTDFDGENFPFVIA